MSNRSEAGAQHPESSPALPQWSYRTGDAHPHGGTRETGFVADPRTYRHQF